LFSESTETGINPSKQTGNYGRRFLTNSHSNPKAFIIQSTFLCVCVNQPRKAFYPGKEECNNDNNQGV